MKRESIRNEIARSIRAIRLACFGRKCLKDCIRRMAAAAPSPRATRRSGGAVVAAALVSMWALAASANVICVWRQDHYECSGEGNKIDVYSGGDGEQPYVITNIVGTCTNCVAMSPDYVRQWKSDAQSEALLVFNDVDGVMTSITIAKNTIRDITSDYPLSNTPYKGTVVLSSELPAATNYLVSIGFPSGPYANNVAHIVAQQNIPSFITANAAARLYNTRSWLSSYDSAVDTYNYICRDLASADSSLTSANRQCEEVRNGVLSLYGMVGELSDEQCTAQWGGGSGSSGTLTNQVNGNWCTYDQGEAIKTLLSDIKDWQEKTSLYASNILNYASSIDNTITRALFSSYDHIPTETELGMTWQQLYLRGYSPNFHGYENTNIIARIELLLAGMSGVLTNGTDFTEAEQLSDDQDDQIDTIKDTLQGFSSSFESELKSREDATRSIGDALIGLYQSFRSWTGAPFSTEQVINSYSIQMGDDSEHLDVPGFAMRQQDVAWANVIRVVIRSCMSVIYIFLTISIFIKFQIVFFQWCWKYVKWAIELFQGLFV